MKKYLLSKLFLFAALLLSGLVFSSVSHALSGPWIELPNAKARLVVTGDPMSGRLQAALEIELDKDWKTYWRFPGDSGIPPTLNWENASNVASTHLRFPAPQRFKDEYGQSVGYKHRVVFPIDIELTHAGRPTQLVVDTVLGICREVCIPVAERFSLKVPPIFVPTAASVATLKDANSYVPGPISIEDRPLIATSDREGTTPLLSIRVPLNLEIDDVFVEGPETWFLSLPKKATADATHQLWELPLDGTPVGKAPWGAEMRVTLVGKTRSFEQAFSLDAPN